MAIFFLQFVFLLLFSLLIIHFISRKKKKGKSFSMYRTLILFGIGILFYRPLILAMWMVSIPWFLAFHVFVVYIATRKKKSWNDAAARFAKLFLFLLPVYLCLAILFFSISVGGRCDLISRQKGLKPVFSFCDKSNIDKAKSFTKSIYHCRNIFFSADRSVIYIGFGAETNQNSQPLIGVDRKTLEITRQFPSHTVFRAYCNRQLNSCIQLITPKNTIRFWDDKNSKTVNTVIFPKDRPRFISVDVDDPQKVYVASDGNWIGVADLERRRLSKKIKTSFSSILDVDNTHKYVVYTSSNFFQPVFTMMEKRTGKHKSVTVGMSTFWKSFGFLYNIVADPERETAFVAAPFECAIYMIDLNEGKITWRKPMPIMIREMTFDTKRRVLYASNYINGYVYKFDVSERLPKYTGKFFVGRRVRYFKYEPDEDVFLSASADGYFVYDPKEAALNAVSF